VLIVALLPGFVEEYIYLNSYALFILPDCISLTATFPLLFFMVSLY